MPPMRARCGHGIKLIQASESGSLGGRVGTPGGLGERRPGGAVVAPWVRTAAPAGMGREVFWEAPKAPGMAPAGSLAGSSKRQPGVADLGVKLPVLGTKLPVLPPKLPICLQTCLFAGAVSGRQNGPQGL